MIHGTSRAADMPERRSDTVRAMVAEMLADAQTRSSLMADPTRSGYDGGFRIGSSNGNFDLNVKALVQFRYHLNFRNADGIVNSNDFESGFNAPRTLLFFKGHVIDPKIYYQIRLNFNRATGLATLDDAFVGYKFNNHWSVQWGQSLHPFDREWYHGDLKLLAVERSIPALVFGSFRTQNLQIKYQNEQWRIYGTFSDGLRSANSEFTADPAEWALTGRAEWKYAGQWSQVGGEYTSPRGSNYAGAIGAALHVEQGESAPSPATEQDLFAWTVDVVSKGNGWNFFAAATGYHTHDEAGVSEADFDEYGAVVQGGVYVTDDVEVFSRYSIIIPDDNRVGDDTFSTLTAGFNWYIHGQAAKFTLQGQWFFDPTTGTIAGNFANTGGRSPTSTLFGVLPSAEENQVTITAQFQLLF